MTLSAAHAHREDVGNACHSSPNAGLIPEEMFWNQRQGSENRNTTNTNTKWLLPGARAGQHVHPATLSGRLKVLGIDSQRARNATLRDLTQEVDA